MTDLWVRFWGVRGSIPVPGPSTVRYGGNTSCLELRSSDGDWVVFDAGTGIRVLGDSLDLSQKHEIHILVSHPHWDHIHGFPFFSPIYIPGNRIRVYGPSTFELSIEDIINGQMKYSYFPVRTAELLADVKFRDLKEETLNIGNFVIGTKFLNHPVTCLGYKVTYRGKTFVYLGDNEPYYNVYNDGDPQVDAFVTRMNSGLAEFVKGVDVLVCDAQYTPGEYPGHRGWGHSTMHHTVNISLKAGVKRLFFFHHEPQRSDEELDTLVRHYRDKVKARGYGLRIDAAAEKETFYI